MKKKRSRTAVEIFRTVLLSNKNSNLYAQQRILCHDVRNITRNDEINFIPRGFGKKHMEMYKINQFATCCNFRLIFLRKKKNYYGVFMKNVLDNANGKFVDVILSFLGRCMAMLMTHGVINENSSWKNCRGLGRKSVNRG